MVTSVDSIALSTSLLPAVYLQLRVRDRYEWWKGKDRGQLSFGDSRAAECFRNLFHSQLTRAQYGVVFAPLPLADHTHTCSSDTLLQDPPHNSCSPMTHISSMASRRRKGCVGQESCDRRLLVVVGKVLSRCLKNHEEDRKRIRMHRSHYEILKRANPQR